MVEPAFFLTPKPILLATKLVFSYVTEVANSNACRSQAGNIMGDVYLYLKLKESSVSPESILLFYTPLFLKHIALPVYLSLLLLIEICV